MPTGYREPLLTRFVVLSMCPVSARAAFSDPWIRSVEQDNALSWAIAMSESSLTRIPSSTASRGSRLSIWRARRDAKSRWIPHPSSLLRAHRAQHSSAEGMLISSQSVPMRQWHFVSMATAYKSG